MDTKLIVKEILATNISQQELADLVPCSQSLIAAYANGTRGKRPTMIIGNRLIELHNQRCKKSKQNRHHDTPELVRETAPVEMRLQSDAGSVTR